MFSRRTAWSREPNPLSVRLDELRAQGARLFDLTETNPTRCGLMYPAGEILAALASPGALAYEPTPLGLGPAREAVCRHLAEAGAAVDPADIVLSASTSEAYAWVFKLLCEPGDNVLSLAPSYPLLDFLTALEAVELRRCPLAPGGGWGLDVEELEARADERTRAVVVVNPGNPTGQYLKRWELAALEARCAERGWALICDEVFSDYALGEDPDRVRTLAGRATQALAFTLSGLSKVAGLPQLKVGWIYLGGPEALRREALARLELVADTYLSVNTPAQLALPRLLEAGRDVRRQILERVQNNRQTLRERQAAGAGSSLLPAEGGWSAVLRVSRHEDEDALCLRLLEAGVVVQPGYFFDFPSPGYLVLSCLPPVEVFSEGVDRLTATLEAGP